MIQKAVMAPKGTPRPIIDKLAVAFKKMTEDKSFINMNNRLGDVIDYKGPDELSKFWREEWEATKEFAKAYKK